MTIEIETSLRASQQGIVVAMRVDDIAINTLRGLRWSMIDMKCCIHTQRVAELFSFDDDGDNDDDNDDDDIVLWRMMCCRRLPTPTPKTHDGWYLHIIHLALPPSLPTYATTGDDAAEEDDRQPSSSKQRRTHTHVKRQEAKTPYRREEDLEYKLFMRVTREVEDEDISRYMITMI